MGLEEEIADKKSEKSKEQRNVKHMGTHTDNHDIVVPLVQVSPIAILVLILLVFYSILLQFWYHQYT